MKHTTRITDATTEPVDLAAAKHHLRETLVSTPNDDYIEGLITVARLEAERRMERTLLPATWLRTLDAFPCAITLYMGPVIAVDWVKYVDAAGTLQTLDSAAWLLNTTNGVVTPAHGTSWPATRCQPGAVTVQYTAGYATAADVPANFKHWILLAVADLYENRQRSADKPMLPQGFADALLDMAPGV